MESIQEKQPSQRAHQQLLSSVYTSNYLTIFDDQLLISLENKPYNSYDLASPHWWSCSSHCSPSLYYTSSPLWWSCHLNYTSPGPLTWSLSPLWWIFFGGLLGISTINLNVVTSVASSCSHRQLPHLPRLPHLSSRSTGYCQPLESSGPKSHTEGNPCQLTAR